MPTFAELEGLSELVMTLAAHAEQVSHRGKSADAVVLFDRAIETSVVVAGEMPLGVVGRLAALYRRCGRRDEGVALLRRFRDSQSADDKDARCSARLSKARALAKRTQRTETIAQLSLRPLVRSSRPTARGHAPEQEGSPMEGAT